MTTKKPSKTTHESITDNSSPEPVTSRLGLPRKYIIPLVIMLIIGVLYTMRSLFIAATVNGQPITRISVIKELEKQAGKQALESMVTKTLIQQEAKKKNIIITEKDVAAEIKTIESNIKSQGQTLDAALAMQGMTKKDLEEQIKIQKMIEKLAAGDIKVSAKEIEDYIEANKAMMGEGTDPEAMKKNAKDMLTQQKKSEKMQAFITDLQKKSKINYFVTY